MNIWLSRKAAARQISRSGDTVKRRGIPWRDDFIEGKLRWKWLELDESTRKQRRYFESDVEAMLATRRPLEPLDSNVWLKRKVAARKISVSGDTIERRGVPWCVEFIKGKIRWQPDPNSQGHRLYFEPDVEALLAMPRPLALPVAWSLIPTPLAA